MTLIQLWMSGLMGIVLLIPLSTFALDCYVCRDCELNFNSSLIVKCSKSSARCVKIVNENGVVDRTCGDTAKCGGREGFQFPPPTQRPRPSSSPENLSSRQKRGLLPESPSQKQQGFKELTALHCCTENECNTSPPSQFTCSFSSLTSILLFLFLSRI